MWDVCDLQRFGLTTKNKGELALLVGAMTYVELDKSGAMNLALPISSSSSRGLQRRRRPADASKLMTTHFGRHQGMHASCGFGPVF